MKRVKMCIRDRLSQVPNMLQSMAAAAERVFEFLNEPEEDQQADPARRADPGCINGQVTFSLSLIHI